MRVLKSHELIYEHEISGLTIEDLNVDFSKNRRVDPHWSIQMNFLAHKCLPCTLVSSSNLFQGQTARLKLPKKDFLTFNRSSNRFSCPDSCSGGLKTSRVDFNDSYLY